MLAASNVHHWIIATSIAVLTPWPLRGSAGGLRSTYVRIGPKLLNAMASARIQRSVKLPRERRVAKARTAYGETVNPVTRMLLGWTTMWCNSRWRPPSD